jgi:uncharacterized protein YegP (UPF0339 family)
MSLQDLDLSQNAGLRSTTGIVRDTRMTYRKYQDTNRQWRWRLVAANGRIIANSGEGYYNETDCDSAIQLVKSSFNAPVVKE